MKNYRTKVIDQLQIWRNRRQELKDYIKEQANNHNWDFCGRMDNENEATFECMQDLIVMFNITEKEFSMED